MTPWPRRHLPSAVQRRCQITRVACCSAGGQLQEGADRYQVHVVTDIERPAGGRGRAELASGIPLNSATSQMICPDATTITHVTASSGEPLDLGRLQRVCSRAHHRAIMVRDGARCRAPGCGARHCDICRLRAWEHDGPTAIDNGAYICRRHHRAIHRGDIVVSGSANATLSFSRRDGTLIARPRLGPTRPGC